MDKVSAPLQRMNKRISKSAERLKTMQNNLKDLSKAQGIADSFMGNSRAADELKGKVRAVSSELSTAL